MSLKNNHCGLNICLYVFLHTALIPVLYRRPWVKQHSVVDVCGLQEFQRGNVPLDSSTNMSGL